VFFAIIDGCLIMFYGPADACTRMRNHLANLPKKEEAE